MRRRLNSIGMVLLAWGVHGAGVESAAEEAATPASSEAALRDLQSANGLLNRGLHDLAAADYRKFLKSNGDHPEAAMARYGLAVCLSRLGDPDGAVKELRQVIEAPGFELAAEALTLLGQSQLQLKKHKESSDTFARVMREHPEHALADTAAALQVEALYAEGKHDRVIERSKSFLKNRSKSPMGDRVRLVAGLGHLARDEWESAAEHFRELTQSPAPAPYRDQAMLMLGQCLDRMAKTDEAAGCYRQVIESASSEYWPDALYGLAVVCHRQGKIEEAESLLDRFLRDHAGSPLQAHVQMLRGRALIDREQYDAAAQLLSQVEKSSPDLSEEAGYWLAKCRSRQGDPAGAARNLGRILEQHPESPLAAAMLYDRAVALAQAGEDETALSALEDFRSRTPKHPLNADALHLSATLEHRRKNYADSAGYAGRFLKDHPDHTLAAAAFFLQAENRFLEGQFDQAAEAYRGFLKRFPEDAQRDDALYRLGLSLWRLERFEEAEAPLTQSLALLDQKPIYRQCLPALGDIAFRRGEWKRAEEYFVRYLEGGIELSGADDALLKLGLACQRQDRHDEALKNFERLLRELPKSPHRIHARFELGQSFVALNRAKEACDAFEAVLAEGGDSRFAAPAMNQLGALSMQGSDFDKAADYFARSAQSGAESAGADTSLFQQAQALLAAQRYPDAEAAFLRFLESDSPSDMTATARAQLAIAVARQDRTAEALKLIEQIERRKPVAGNGMDRAVADALLYEKAWCLRKLDRKDEAAKVYQSLMEASGTGKERWYALSELAELESAAGRCSQAVPLLRQFLDSAETTGLPEELRTQSLYRMAACIFESEEYAQAATLLSELSQRKLTPELELSTHLLLGESEFKLGHHQRAVEHLSRVVESGVKDASRVPALLRLGECLSILQQWPRSEKIFTQFLQDYPDNAQKYQAQFGIGWARENQGRFDEALAIYRELVAAHQGPTAARAQFQIGECLFAQKQHDEAVREFLKVDILYAYPEWSAAALYEAGRCFEVMNKIGEAREQFKTVTEKHGSTHWAELAAQRLAAVMAAGVPGKDGG